ncbi:hypothetical protein BGX33_008536 [Mortierella sp. NVP41]|nr:hypothetical protein BGX33_008536 [Mortierella sp. NVP41]
MSSAIRFFDIAELVYLVARDLETTDILRLAQTTYVYYQGTSNGSIASSYPGNQRATSSTASWPTRTPSPSCPNRLPPPNRSIFPAEPLAPMSDLAKLDINVRYASSQIVSFCPMPKHMNPSNLLGQVCRLVQLSPNLIKLSAHGLVFRTNQNVRFFTGVISGLCSLKALDITLVIESSPDPSLGWLSVWCDFLRNCPKLIERFRWARSYILRDDDHMPDGTDDRPGDE